MVLTRRQSHLQGKDEDCLSEMTTTNPTHKKSTRKSTVVPLPVQDEEIPSEVEQDQREQSEQASNDNQHFSDGSSSSEDDDDDDDIDALLDKAEEALRNQIGTEEAIM
jgi:hypothetical protein